MTDPIADLLTRIRNGIQARQDVVTIPHSRVKEELLKILKKEGYIGNFVKIEAKPQSELKVFLKYTSDRKSVIHRIARVSKPGGRRYRGYRDLGKYRRGLGVAILSTPKGILTNNEAFKAKAGGEVLCEVW